MSAPSSSNVDWEAAKRQIARLEETLRRSGKLSEEQSREILRARADRLAVVPARQAAGNQLIEVMILELAGERYAIETKIIREVIRVRTFTPLPGTADHILGVVNLHGRPLLVADARVFLGLATDSLADSARIIVIGQTQAEFGLLVEATEEVATVDIGNINDPPNSLNASARQVVRGVTSDVLIVIDPDRLLKDPRLWIDDQEE